MDDKSLNELEKVDWGEPQLDTHLASTLHRIRKLPLTELDESSIYTLVLHQVGFELVLERALQIVEKEPVSEAKYYPGDLLSALARIPPQHWPPEQRPRFASLLAGAGGLLKDYDWTPEEAKG